MKIYKYLLSTILLLVLCCTSKSKLIAKKWFVYETEIAGQKLSGDLVDGFYLDIKPEGNYQLMGMGEENGTWTLKNDSLRLTNSDKRTVHYFITHISDEKLVLFDNSVGTHSTIVFVSKQ